MYKLVISAIPLLALFLYIQFQETSIHDTIGQTITFKAEISEIQIDQKQKYKFMVSIQDFDDTYQCIVHSKDLAKQVQSMSNQVIVFQTKTCKKQS